MSTLHGLIVGVVELRSNKWQMFGTGLDYQNL